MKKIVAILMAMLMVMSVTVVLASGVTDKDTQPKVPVIIGFEDTPSQSDKDMIRGCGGDITHSYTIINAIAAKLPEQAINKIKKNPSVAYVEMDGEVHALEETLPWGVDRIDAEIVHAYNKGLGVKVAIIDTGIDKDHPDLQANIKGGVNFVSNPYWRPADPEKWDDDNGHGTHCAGIAAAVDNEEGVIGVAPEAHLYGVKVLDRTGSGYVSDVIAGIEWSIANGMQVISMSLGSGSDISSLHDACDDAYGAGIVVVAAAGNSGPDDNTVIYPAKYDSVIAVSATNSDDSLADFSSRGPEVELAAPGVSIYSTIPGGYDTKSGTSMACPHVTGTAALVIASDSSLSNVDVRQRLQGTAEDLGDSGEDNLYGHGLVDAFEAAPDEDTTPPTISDLTPANEAFVNTVTPTISATVTDVSGIVETSIVMTVDEATVSHSYDSATGIVSYTTSSLAEGLHTAELEVTDTVSNQATESWSFTVDITPPNAIADLEASTGEYPDISLTWALATDNFGVSYYNIYRSTDPTINKATDLLAQTTATSYTDSTGDAETTYYYAVCAVDLAENEAGLSNIAEATVDSAPDNTIHVASINMSSDNRRAGRNTFVWAVATVTIVNESGNLVEGATVSGHWSDATSNSDSGVTDASGQVLLESDSVKNPPSGTTFTFTIDGVTHADLTWDGEPASGSITV